MEHLLPSLPYAVAALEPHIDARTMTVHRDFYRDFHHAAYVKALHAVLAEAPTCLRDKSGDWLLANLAQVRQTIRKSRRPEYGHDGWQVVDWHEVAASLARVQPADKSLPEAQITVLRAATC